MPFLDSPGMRSSSGAVPVTETLSGSPHTLTNSNAYPVLYLVSIGTVTLIEYSRDGAAWFSVGLIAGSFCVSPGDRLRITYAVAPTVVRMPL